MRTRMRHGRHGQPSDVAVAPVPSATDGVDRSNDRLQWLFALGLLLLTLAVYLPAWNGGLLWDDNFHLTRPDLRSWTGLGLIWTKVGTTLQYYPLLHSVFWVEQRIWGDATLGYHLVTILMHVGTALLFALVLRRLKVPGAWLAAAIFALHPVQAESVAWMTELKNTLSGVFYFGAALAYLRFDETRKRSWYLAAFATFVLAILTKTVTGTLPAALLLVFWWKRGRLEWKNDVAPLAPMLALGAVFGAVTARWELLFNKCDGPAFQFTAVERVLIAGRAVWFHLGKLLWPSDLAFIYPRWRIDTSAWWQYLFPLAAIALLVVLWAWRRRSRAPLAAALFYGGTLFPVLGFFNLYTFRYSFVANHYQYLACAGVSALVSAGAVDLGRRLGTRGRTWLACAAAALVATLSALTWLESRTYVSAETLYRTTIARNPSCWLAHTNLAALELDASVDDALAHVEEALRLDPDIAEAHSVMGDVWQRKGRPEEAAGEYARALSINPSLAGAGTRLAGALALSGRYGEAAARYRVLLSEQEDSAGLRVGLGNALQHLGRAAEAAAAYEEALRLRPDDADAHYGLGVVLQRAGRLDEALAHYERALPVMAASAELENNLGSLLDQMGRPGEAEPHFRQALRVDPRSPDAHFNLANLLLNAGRADEAATQYREVVALNSHDAEAHNNLGVALMAMGRRSEAAAEFRQALSLKPDYPDAARNLGRARSGCGGLGEC
jgi:protein O-mannosyl-transferase